MLDEQTWIADAVEALAGPATGMVPEKAYVAEPVQYLPKAMDCAPQKAARRAPSAKLIRKAKASAPQRAKVVPPSEPHAAPAAADGQSERATSPECRAIGTIVELHRRRWDMIRARQRLELQAQATLRRLHDGDKAAAGKEWARIKKAPETADPWLAAYVNAMQPLLAMQTDAEKRLAKAVRTLPIYAWAKAVSGLGDVSLSAIIGECAHPVGSYRSHSAVWKRMGLAVVDGGRQRRVAGDAALLHGYSPARRSIMWNIGACLIKAQVRSAKDEDGNKAASTAIGPYGQLYLDRKALEAARVDSAAHAHNRAQRYVEKRLLRDMWKAWRALDGVTECEGRGHEKPADGQTDRAAPLATEQVSA